MLREFAKKSPFVKRFVRNYRSCRNQPSWSHVLNKNKDYWELSLSRAKKGQQILIATSVGSHLAGTMLESMLAVALTLRGADVHVLLCDGILPACLSCSFDIYADPKRFAKDGPRKDCKSCFKPAFEMYNSLGVTVHMYSTYLSSKEFQKIEEISLSTKFHDIKDYKLDGLAVGEHALAGALRFFARGTLEDEPYAEHILHRYFKASLLSVFVISNLLEKHDFDSAVFHHGIYVPQGLIGEVCRSKSLHVVNWNPAYRKNCFIFSHHDTYHHTMMREPIEKWMNITWNKQVESALMDYLKSRWKGTKDWIWFHENPKFEIEEIDREFNIDFNKPCIGLLTSVMWDAVLHYPSNAFPNMLDWVLRTIDYFIKRPDLQLIIRIHPAEIHGTLPSRQKMLDEIKKVYSELPKNIIVIPPESQVSTYAIMLQCDTVIIYNTKTGIELTAMGVPVIVAGEAWIRNKGFSIEVDNPEAYFNLLDKLPMNRRMSPEATLKARKYAYHFFFRRMMPLEFMIPSSGNPPFKIKIEDLSVLAKGESKVLDIICEGILYRKDFIYPS